MIDWTSIVLTLLYGVISGIIASFLYFYLFFIRLKPKILISKQISKREKDGLMEYEIKVRNDVKSRSAINIRAELLLVTPRNVPEGGMVLKTDYVQLKRSELFEVGKFNPKDDSTKDEAQYAFQFRTVQAYKKDEQGKDTDEKDASLEDLWSDSERTYLLFRVFATDPLSGLGKVFSKEYHSKSDNIQEGDFGYATDMNVRGKSGK